MMRTKQGKAYGLITAKAFAVFQALLYDFHNAKSGRCFPSYEAIAKKIGCARSTVALAIKTLELVRLMTWCNRIVRTLKGVTRTSNAYWFQGEASKSEKKPETITKILPSLAPELQASLDRLQAAIQRRNQLSAG
jgi:hypothetical protein